MNLTLGTSTLELPKVSTYYSRKKSLARMSNLIPKNIEIRNTKLPEWEPYRDKNNYSSFHATLHNATLD